MSDRVVGSAGGEGGGGGGVGASDEVLNPHDTDTLESPDVEVSLPHLAFDSVARYRVVEDERVPHTYIIVQRVGRRLSTGAALWQPLLRPGNGPQPTWRFGEHADALREVWRLVRAYEEELGEQLTRLATMQARVRAARLAVEDELGIPHTAAAAAATPSPQSTTTTAPSAPAPAATAAAAANETKA